MRDRVERLLEVQVPGLLGGAKHYGPNIPYGSIATHLMFDGFIAKQYCTAEHQDERLLKTGQQLMTKLRVRQ